MAIAEIFSRPKQLLGKLLVRYLTSPVHTYHPFSVTATEVLREVLQTGDVLLVEGNQHFSTAVKYLTQSTWSHAAMYVGELAPGKTDDDEPLVLIEADLEHGVRAVPLSRYRRFNTRICRPAGLDEATGNTVAQFMVDSLGMEYDLKNVIDLARYLFPSPPVPASYRRRMLAFGSGDPTRVICSTRIAQAFQSVGYPILPDMETLAGAHHEHGAAMAKEILHIRHHTLFTPRDFDLSPYFAVIKPTIERGFDYRELTWEQ